MLFLYLIIFYVEFVCCITNLTTKTLRAFFTEQVAAESAQALSKNFENGESEKLLLDEFWERRQRLLDEIWKSDPDYLLFKRYQIDKEDWITATLSLLFIYGDMLNNEMVEKPSATITDPYIYELQFILNFNGFLSQDKIKHVIKALYFHAIFGHESLTVQDRKSLDTVIQSYVEKFQQMNSTAFSDKTQITVYDFNLFLIYSHTLLVFNPEEFVEPHKFIKPNEHLIAEVPVHTIKDPILKKIEKPLQAEPYFHRALSKFLLMHKKTADLTLLYKQHYERGAKNLSDLPLTLISYIQDTFNTDCDPHLAFRDFFINFYYSALCSQAPLIYFKPGEHKNSKVFTPKVLFLFIRHLEKIVCQIRIHKWRLTFPFDEGVNNKILEYFRYSVEAIKFIMEVFIETKYFPGNNLEAYKVLINILCQELPELPPPPPPENTKTNTEQTTKTKLPIQNVIPVKNVDIVLAQFGKINLNSSLELPFNLDYEYSVAFELYSFYLLEAFVSFPNANLNEWIALFLPIEKRLSVMLKEKIPDLNQQTILIGHFRALAGGFLEYGKNVFDLSHYKNAINEVRRLILGDLVSVPSLSEQFCYEIRAYLNLEFKYYGVDPDASNSAANMVILQKLLHGKLSEDPNAKIDFQFIN
jgi:hypothetical protein